MIDYTELAFCVEPMTVADISAVMEIEAAAFSAPWSARAYEYELRYNASAHYFVARARGVPHARAAAPVAWWRRWLARGSAAALTLAPLVGHAGFWMMVDEAHISTLATHPQWRRRGIAELLLIAMTERAAEIDARVMTLEVRVSNERAQALYRKYRFEVVGKRVHYYSDNGEDALIMTTPLIVSAEYQRLFQAQKAKLLARLRADSKE